mmetsp:Transcript_90387/g.149805  ORF Transcript_90387/g.149805 Transcript_90387/m.149805 type:complete len:412 (+) Transcript_90387:57-1292(+)
MLRTQLCCVILVVVCTVGDAAASCTRRLHGEETDDASLLQVQLHSVSSQMFRARDISQAPCAGLGGHCGGRRALTSPKMNGSWKLELRPRVMVQEETKHTCLLQKVWRRLPAWRPASGAGHSTIGVLLLTVLCFILVMLLTVLLQFVPMGGTQLVEPKPLFSPRASPKAPSSKLALVPSHGSPMFGVKGSPLVLTTEPSFEKLQSTEASLENLEASQKSSPDPGLPLCPCLIVPGTSRFVCLVKNCIRKKKQSMAFHVRSSPASLCRPLFRINVSEFGNRSGITVETIDGEEELCFLSTEPLWNSSSGAETFQGPTPLNIFRPKGDLFGSVQAHKDGYQVLRGDVKLMDLSGDFADHNINVKAANGQALAMTRPYDNVSADEYELSVFSGVDAGLVLLALMGADKCRERYA